MQPDTSPAETTRSSASMDPRSAAMVFCGVTSVVLFAVVAFVPVPYVIERPGPVRNTLSEVDGVPLIDVEGAPTYPTEGALDLTTVSVSGGPGRSVDLADVVAGWLDPTVAVVPVEQAFRPEATEQQIEDQNAQEMVSSQENATAAALAELAIDVPTTLTVVGFSEGSDAERQLRDGDVLTSIDDTEVVDLPDLRDVLQRVQAPAPVLVGVVRDGEDLVLEVATLPGAEKRTLLGVLLDPTYKFPFDVTIAIENIGGPSAGMMFALGLVDKLTPGAMTGGEQVAGTGTIDSSGAVGPIGGIAQKMVGARDAGARWFLAPQDNCAEAAQHVPAGLRVVKVATLAQARDGVETIGSGEGIDALPTCTG